jgi:hypothetical protein
MGAEHAPLDQEPSEEPLLRWLPQLAVAHAVSDDGRRLTRELGNPIDLPWAAGETLPKKGHSAWTICVERADDEMGDHVIGVCDASTKNAWGLLLSSGELRRFQRDTMRKAFVDLRESHPLSPIRLLFCLMMRGHGLPAGCLPLLHCFGSAKTVGKPTRGEPPAGWPDGMGTRVLAGDEGARTTDGKVTGALIEVLVDHDAGTLAFSVNGGPREVALEGFPRGAALRPWATLRPMFERAAAQGRDALEPEEVRELKEELDEAVSFARPYAGGAS